MKEETLKAIEKIRSIGFGAFADQLLVLGGAHATGGNRHEINLLESQARRIEIRLKELNSTHEK